MQLGGLEKPRIENASKGSGDKGGGFATVGDKVSDIVSAKKPRSSMSIEKFTPIAILATGLFVTQQLWKSSVEETERGFEAEFAAQSQEAVGKIEKRMEIYEQVLVGVDGLFARKVPVSRDEFARYVNRLGLKEKYPGIQGVRFVPYVPQSEAREHVRKMRAEGFSNYRIFPEGNRPFYAPATYIEPYDPRNAAIFGYDMYSDKTIPRIEDYARGTRSGAMDLAWKSGKTTISGKVRLLTEVDPKDIQPGFLMFRPVYESGADPESSEKREAHPSGWVSLVFRMGDLMEGILGKKSDQISVSIYDGETASEESLLYRSSKSRPENPAFATERHLKIGERVWTIEVRSLPEFEKVPSELRTHLTAALGVLVSLLLSMLAGIASGARTKAKEDYETAVSANQELRRKKIELEEALSKLSAFNEAVNRSAIVSATDAAGRIVYVNERFCDISEYRADELIGSDHNIVRSDEHGEEVFADMWDTIKSGQSWRGEICNRAKSGKPYWMDATIVPIRDEKEKITGYLSIRNDITDRKRIENDLRKNEGLLNTVFQKANAGICLVDTKGNFLRVNPKMEGITGYSSEELIGTTVENITLEEDVGLSGHFIGLANRGTQDDDVFEKRYRRKDGSVAYVQVSYSTVRDDDGAPLYFVAYVQDIAELKEREMEAYRKASYDSLTGLPNRSLMTDRLTMAISRTKHHRNEGVFMFVDLDGFKYVNDTYGHDVGDGLLKEVANRMTSVLREEDTVARIGGDEFAVILGGISHASANAGKIAEKILSGLSAPFVVNGYELKIGGSVGISVFPKDGTDPETIQKKADTAMYAVKKAGKNGYRFFEEG